MNVTDPIADFLTRIRNAQSAGHKMVSIPASKMKIAMTYILKREGFIKDFRCIRDNKQGIIKILLRYTDNDKGVIVHVQRQSRPGRRVFVGVKDIPYVKNGFGFGMYSTSRGVMTCREARQKGVGGEYLCSVF
ncbi:MAG: 30S ribosomal protein S8 [Proteobacteria bacterium]|nr:30S ribosomal protein S8 [Pseudomonadota bacterium]